MKLPLAIACAAVCCAVPVDAAPPRITGPIETVFDWQRERCARWHVPDAPARAWRGSDGAVHLIAGSEQNRQAVGPDLASARPDCAIVYQGSHSDDPAAYDDRSWIAAVFTTDGKRVEALVHGEYHGDLRPERCPAQKYLACWRNAIVAAVSLDDGLSFKPLGLVAALPYRYGGDAGRRAGYFNPSNVVREGDYLYVFVFAEAYGAQKRGACLLRRPIAGDAGDWRAWDGTGFGARFADPYREDIRDPARHVCAPVPRIESTISTVVRHEVTGGYLALTATAIDGRSGIYATQSDDLVHWSEPRLLWAAPLLWRRACAAPAAFAYPSLLDAASASPTFDSVGDRFWLYLVRIRLADGCKAGPDRDLIRMPVSWPATAARSAGRPGSPGAPPDPPGGSTAP